MYIRSLYAFDIKSNHTLFTVMNDYRIAREELARLISVDLKEITYVLYKIRVENSYVSFKIPKKNGEHRVIDTPDDKLKWIQRKLSEKLHQVHSDYMTQNGIKTSVSHGFEKNKSIKIGRAHV